MIEIGQSHTSELTVTEAVTAIASTTVGGHIASSHLKPSKLGDTVTATATVTKVDGKKIEFKVEARCGDTLLGEGTHLRFIVDREKFMSRL